MKILFLCSSMEPGQDGVGDYTRLLAGACLALGWECSVIALHDRHVEAPVESIEDGRTPVLRLPETMPWSRRLELATAFLRRAQPDWVSLQFVSYGFAARGLVWNLGACLRCLIEGARVHVMFHELWIGAYREASPKERLIGGLQKMCIRRMLRNLAPALVTTSNRAFLATLQRAGIPAALLPLFGNIPIVEHPRVEWFHEELRKAGLPMEGGTQTDCWVFAFFGTLHPAWRPEPLFSYVQDVAKRWEKSVVIASIGRLGPGAALWAHLSREYAGAFRFVSLGERPAKEVSGFLQCANFGIAASPWELIGKSGSVAGMIEHGLPVIVSRDDIHFAGFRDDDRPQPGLTKMTADLPARLPFLRRRSPKPSLPEEAANFVRSLRALSGNLL